MNHKNLKKQNESQQNQHEVYKLKHIYTLVIYSLEVKDFFWKH